MTENIPALSKKIKTVSTMIGTISLNPISANCEKLKSFNEKNSIINAAIKTTHFFDKFVLFK